MHVCGRAHGDVCCDGRDLEPVVDRSNRRVHEQHSGDLFFKWKKNSITSWNTCLSGFCPTLRFCTLPSNRMTDESDIITQITQSDMEPVWLGWIDPWLQNHTYYSLEYYVLILYFLFKKLSISPHMSGFSDSLLASASCSGVGEVTHWLRLIW